MESRREFLKLLLGLAAVSCDPLDVLAAGAKQPKGKLKGAGKPAAHRPPAAAQYKLATWTGDDFTLGHQMRVGKAPADFPQSAEATYDVVIVGGGIGGLSSAYFLRDHNILLLEQYESLGGQARGGSFKGINYSWGPAYVGLVDGLYGKLYDELGIKPEPLPENHNSFFWDHKWTQGFTQKEQGDLFKSFKKLTAQMSDAAKSMPAEDTPEAMDTPQWRALDQMRLSQSLSGYDQRFIALLDSICRSACCGNTGMISAAAGYYLLDDLRSQSYCFAGGNPAVARALVDKLNAAGSDRLRTGSFVWSIKLNESGANVLYTDSHGQGHNVACKHVIVATPPLVAWRQFSNLSDKMRIALMPFRFGSYLVANLLLSKKTAIHCYDNFVSAPFSFTDFVLADTPYQLAGKDTGEASVLTVYQPWEPGTAGRPLLLAGDRSTLSKLLLDELQSLVEHLTDHLQEVVLTRWGHAMPVPSSSYYAQLRKILAAYDGNYTFAHSSTQGLPSTEAAIRAGKFAAQRSLSLSGKTSWLFESALPPA